MMDERFLREAERLKFSPLEGKAPGGVGTVQFTANCDGNAAVVIQRVKEVLATTSQYALSDWPSEEQWKSLLPDWFLSACAPLETKDEADKFMTWWRSLPPEQQAQAEREKDWSLGAWLYWMDPENRVWTWWDARVMDADRVMVAVEIVDWPFPWGALRWLFRAAGAQQLETET
jgi:hypothetical protein